jgi:hypothetical protein
MLITPPIPMQLTESSLGGKQYASQNQTDPRGKRAPTSTARFQRGLTVRALFAHKSKSEILHVLVISLPGMCLHLWCDRRNLFVSIWGLTDKNDV